MRWGSLAVTSALLALVPLSSPASAARGKGWPGHYLDRGGDDVTVVVKGQKLELTMNLESGKDAYGGPAHVNEVDFSGALPPAGNPAWLTWSDDWNSLGVARAWLAGPVLHLVVKSLVTSDFTFFDMEGEYALRRQGR